MSTAQEIPTHCIRCGSEFINNECGIYKDEYYCYKCCGECDIEYMLENGKNTFYLVRVKHPTYEKYEVTNWPGSLRLPVISWSKGSHNIGGKRIDVWFRGPDGKIWWGWKVHGGWSDIIKVRRTKLNF
tara:strand:- start:530 stop:913 length:384 start_codon:yes stop_codon:yes gene_type:complete